MSRGYQFDPLEPSEADDAVRHLMLLMPRLVGRAKRIPPPERLQSLDLAPRHLALLSLLQLDGPMTVSHLAEVLGIAPTTVSLMVSELARKGVLERREDEADRRRRIVDIATESRAAIFNWLAPSAAAWRQVLRPLTQEQRILVVDTLHAYESALDDALFTSGG